MSELIGAIQEAVEVVKFIAFAQAIVSSHLACCLLNVVCACTGVVGAYCWPGEAAQQLCHGLAHGFAENIPKGDVKSGIAPHFSP